MILAEKIMNERKKNGWSQEELAEQLSVSRQSVSKWESAQAVPDLQKIIKMAEIFGVSTDYLLKDEIEPEDMVQELPKDASPYTGTVHKVSLEEANKYMDAVKCNAPLVANGVSLCILSPALLIVLGGISEEPSIGLSEAVAAGIGMLALFVLIAIAVFIFIRNGLKMKEFEYIKEDMIETEYGVIGVVKNRKTEFAATFTTQLSVGIVLCVLCAVPLIMAGIMNASDTVLAVMVGILLLMVSVGVNLIVRASSVKESFDALLQENEYTGAEKKSRKKTDPIMGIYWSVVTAGYLLWSFLTNDWHITWVVWPVAGVLSVVVSGIIKIVTYKEA